MPDKHRTVLSAMVLLVLIATLISGCCACCGVGAGKFVFLERSTEELSTEVVSGNEPYPQPIPSVPYSYDERTGKLQVLDPQNFYNHYSGLKIFYGEKAMLKVGGHINGNFIRELPYVGTEVTITDVEGDGRVHFSYKSQKVILNPGENWSGDRYSITVNAQGRNGPVTMNMTRIDTFTNYGLLDATSITF